MLIIISKMVICAVAAVLILLVMLQKPKEGSAGSSFGQESSARRGQSATTDAMLGRMTKIGIGVFFALSFALLVIQRIAA